MQYSDYRLDQITAKLNNYQYLCNIFLDLASSNEMRTKLEEILYAGGCNGFGFNSGLSNKDNPSLEGQRRIAMAYLLIRNPETFNFFIENQIALFHGTNSNILSLMLKYGLNSHAALEKMGISVTTGERWSRGADVRDFISFSDILGVACNHLLLGDKDSNNCLSFEVIIGITVSSAKQARLCRVLSDEPEVGLRNGLPVESIGVICVPSDKVELVKSIVGSIKVAVLPMDDTRERFYAIAEDEGIYIYPDMIEDLKKRLPINSENDASYGSR